MLCFGSYLLCSGVTLAFCSGITPVGPWETIFGAGIEQGWPNTDNLFPALSNLLL